MAQLERVGPAAESSAESPRVADGVTESVEDLGADESPSQEFEARACVTSQFARMSFLGGLDDESAVRGSPGALSSSRPGRIELER